MLTMEKYNKLKTDPFWKSYRPQGAKEPATWSIDTDTKQLISMMVTMNGIKNQSVLTNELIIRGIISFMEESNDPNR